MSFANEWASECVCAARFDEINSTDCTTRNRNAVYVYVQWLKRLIASESVCCACVCSKIVFFRVIDVLMIILVYIHTPYTR